MSHYEKQNFVKDQILEAEHLNHMEDGIKQLSEEMVKTINGVGSDENGNVIVPPELPPPEDIPIADGDLMPFDKVLGVGVDFDSDELSPRWELITPPGTEAVRFTNQTLNVNQQAQARENIGAQPKGEYASKADVDKLTEEIAELKNNGGTLVVTITGDGVEYTCDKSPEEIYNTVMAGVPVSGVLVENGTVYTMTLLEISTSAAYFRYIRYDMSGDATGKVFYLNSSEVSVYCEFCHVHTNRAPV